MSNDDLSHLLNTFSISTNEEKLTQQLDQTHLDSNKTPSIFNVQTTTSNQQQQQQWLPPQTNTNEQGWNPDTTVNNTSNEEEGWGDDPPAYTSISQGTYFGFNSIMQPEIYNRTTTSETTQNTTAFSKYKNKPVSFTSALDTKKQ